MPATFRLPIRPACPGALLAALILTACTHARDIRPIDLPLAATVIEVRDERPARRNRPEGKPVRVGHDTNGFGESVDPSFILAGRIEDVVRDHALAALAARAAGMPADTRFELGVRTFHAEVRDRWPGKVIVAELDLAVRLAGAGRPPVDCRITLARTGAAFMNWRGTTGYEDRVAAALAALLDEGLAQLPDDTGPGGCH
ncbi:hypothetical protein [Derxia gummosa]|uniref:Lipoprotein n=1 Tax=Derxia gummosa DSM 723 TaxID=1121388 RepID=A0A8B6X438_9BURK|nr:hypothetical protein [Derxia gummosa]